MSSIRESREIEITESQSPLSFGTEGGGSWEAWDRYLLLNGAKAYHLGNICGTCSFFFERLPGAKASVNPAEVVDALTDGLTTLSSPILNAVQKIIPSGKYFVLLHEILPKIVVPGDESDYFVKEQVDLWGIDGYQGLPHNPRTEYYRTGTQTLKGGSCLFEFLIPFFPRDRLELKKVKEFQNELLSGKQPTAIAISILDVKQPATFEGDPEINEHCCLAHYLIDGHHKTYAANETNKPITLLSFLALDEGISSLQQKVDVIGILMGLKTKLT